MLESQSTSQTKPLISKEYPLELLKALVAGTSLDPPPKITNDILAGMQYALFTLPADQQKLLHLRYIRKLTVLEAAAQLSLPEEEVRCLEKKALASLRFPVKWSYIRHGIAGYMRKRIAQEHRLAYRNGYCDGYRRQGQPMFRAELPSQTLPMPFRISPSKHWISLQGRSTV